MPFRGLRITLKEMSVQYRFTSTHLVSFIAGVVFLVVASVTMVWANGWEYDTDQGRFQQTVIVASEPTIKNASIYLNGKLVASESPWQRRGLSPGRYILRLEKQGYNSWQEIFDLQAGQTGYIHDSVDLVAAKPLITEHGGEFSPSAELFDAGLALEDDELLDNGKLVSRFTTPPLSAHRFLGGYLYQAGRELRLLFTVADQDYLLYSAPSDGVIELEIRSNYLLLKEGQTVKQLFPTEL